MNKLILRELMLSDEASLNCAAREFTDPDFTFVFNYQPGTTDFATFLKALIDGKEEETVPKNFVPSTMLFGFLGREIVGRVSLRHRLNAALEEVGGHLGFGVVPRFRNRGFAKTMVLASYPVAKKVGLSRVLMTCDEGNTASRRTIERCGGVFERHAKTTDGSLKRRYWATLT